MKTTKSPACNRCHIPMKRGKALLNSLATAAGLPGKDGQTVSRSGPATLINVWKCPKCGHSIGREIN